MHINMDKLLNTATQEVSSDLAVVGQAVSDLTSITNLNQNATSDQTGTTIVQGSHNITLATGDPMKENLSEGLQPTDGSSDDYLSCAYTVGAEEQNMERPVYLGTFKWQTAKDPFSVLATLEVPKCFIANQRYPLHGQAGYFSYYRAGFYIQLQIAAPLGYAGILVLSYLPDSFTPLIPVSGKLDSKGLDDEAILAAPYTIIDVSVESTATLVVPYVNHQNYAKMRLGHEGGWIIAWCLTNLMTPAQQTNEISFSMYGALMELDLQCPQVWSNAGRRQVKKKKFVTTQDRLVKVLIQNGPGSWNASNSADLGTAESLAIANERSFVDFKTTGCAARIQDLTEISRKWTIVVSKDWTTSNSAGQSILSFKLKDMMAKGNLGPLMDCFQYFRGSFEIKLLLVAARNVHGRIQLSWYPTATTAYDVNDARNAITVVQDVHGPDVILTLPYTSQTWRHKCLSDYGIVEAHVVNPLTATVAGAASAKIVCLIRTGENFRFYCPWRPQFRYTSWYNLGVGDAIENSDEPNVFINFDSKEIDLHTQSHSEIDHYFGRAWWYKDHNGADAATGYELCFPLDSPPCLARTMAFWTGELVITIQTDSKPAIAAHSYTKPDFSGEGNVAVLQDLLALGAVFIPRYSFKNIVVPYYSRDPLRCTLTSTALGYLYLQSQGRCHIYLALKSSSFFLLVPGTKRTPIRTTGASLNFWAMPETDSESEDSWVRDLTEEGIEPNPGPLQLVTKNRGLYKHYGVKCGDQVYHLNSGNILQSMIKGQATVCIDSFSDVWTPVGSEVYSMGEKYLKAGTFDEVVFNIETNCESWAKKFVPVGGTTQGERLKKALGVAAVLCFVFGGICENQSFGTSILQFLSKVSELVYGGFQSFVVRTVVKTVCKIICYLIMYAHCPNLLTTGVLVLLISLDCTNSQMDDATKKLVDCIVQGKFAVLARALAKEAGVEADDDGFIDDMPDGTSPFEDQGPKEFNAWSTAAKNVQWWFETLCKCFNWIKEKIFPSEICETIDDLEEHQDEIAMTLALVDEHLCNMMTDKTYAVSREAKEKHVILVDMLSGIVADLSRMPRITPLFSRVQGLLQRMQQVNFEPQMDWMARPEPVGIWISGTAGAGKSFLANKLVSDLSRHYGWKCYSNPTGSNHMDGYTDQEIHLFDDFGQNKEEEDYSLICQLISTCPFIVPKADVTAKGTTYRARVVVVTTNRFGFESHKLYDKDALTRRFPIVLKIKPREIVAKNGMLDVNLALKRGHLESGNCWHQDRRASSGQYGEDWCELNYPLLLQDLISQIDARQRILDMIQKGTSDQGGGDFFGNLKARLSNKSDKLVEDASSRIKSFERKVENKIKKKLFINLAEPTSVFDCEKIARTARVALNPPKSKLAACKMLVGEMIKSLKGFLDKHRVWIMAIGALGSIITIASFIIPWGRSRNESIYDGSAPVRLTRDFAAYAQKHVASRLTGHSNQGRMNFDPITKRMVTVKCQGVPATGLMLASKDVITYGHDSFTHVWVDGEDRPVSAVFDVTYGGKPMDLQILTVDTRQQFKSTSHLIHSEDYRGNGFLLWKTYDTFMVQPVFNIVPHYGFKTSQGTLSTYCYIYDCPTTVGTCGGVLVAPVAGNLKILGIHTAGNGVSGVANRVFAFANQGKVVSVEKKDKPIYFQPRVSAYRPSPVYEESEVGPAVLSRNDKRLEVELEDVTKLAASKYVGNQFDPPPACFDMAVSKVISDLRKVVRPSGSISYEIASSSEMLPIDWQTSPGLKYQGFKKADLVMSEAFQRDVEAQLVVPGTYFTTYLKDELRPVSKIKIGKTRAIEACNFDYVVAYRMVMGSLYHQIYLDVEAICGIAVGLCPYKHWGGMVARLYPHVICCDFSGFDGSLPPELMRAAVEVLAAFHEDPSLVRRIHEPVINSTNLVSNEVWQVEGGMCSGAPCTSVLNSTCNLIAAYTVALSLGADITRMHIITYGDDIVISSAERYDVEKMADYYKVFFGMTATSANKTDEIQWDDIENMQFLKRKSGWFPGFSYPVGVLDLVSMLDKIQWTKGNFEQQLESFCLELVLHGEDVYGAVVKDFRRREPRLKIPPYQEMFLKMKAILMDDILPLKLVYPKTTACKGKPIIKEDRLVCVNHENAIECITRSDTHVWGPVGQVELSDEPIDQMSSLYQGFQNQGVNAIVYGLSGDVLSSIQKALIYCMDYHGKHFVYDHYMQGCYDQFVQEWKSPYDLSQFFVWLMYRALEFIRFYKLTSAEIWSEPLDPLPYKSGSKEEWIAWLAHMRETYSCWVRISWFRSPLSEQLLAEARNWMPSCEWDDDHLCTHLDEEMNDHLENQGVGSRVENWF
nr:polyprotein [Picornaviridae sp.]